MYEHHSITKIKYCAFYQQSATDEHIYIMESLLFFQGPHKKAAKNDSFFKVWSIKHHCLTQYPHGGGLPHLRICFDYLYLLS